MAEGGSGNVVGAIRLIRGIGGRGIFLFDIGQVPYCIIALGVIRTGIESFALFGEPPRQRTVTAFSGTGDFIV